MEKSSFGGKKGDASGGAPARLILLVSMGDFANVSCFSSSRQVSFEKLAMWAEGPRKVSWTLAEGCGQVCVLMVILLYTF